MNGIIDFLSSGSSSFEVSLVCPDCTTVPFLHVDIQAPLLTACNSVTKETIMFYLIDVMAADNGLTGYDTLHFVFHTRFMSKPCFKILYFPYAGDLQWSLTSLTSFLSQFTSSQVFFFFL